MLRLANRNRGISWRLHGDLFDSYCASDVVINEVRRCKWKWIAIALQSYMMTSSEFRMTGIPGKHKVKWTSKHVKARGL